MYECHGEQVGVAAPFTDGLRGGRARVEYTSHSWSATAAKDAPSVDASNTARKHRVVTGGNSTLLSASSVLEYGELALTSFHPDPSIQYSRCHALGGATPTPDPAA
jgi:hypothetical protein